MPVYETDTASIMPLMATRGEIDDTHALLCKMNDTWVDLFSTTELDVDALRNIILVGSGDSWTAALSAAVWIENNSPLHCVARQTFEFLNTDLYRYRKETLIVVISASGRPSPVTDALKYALTSQAQVLGLTNSHGSLFSSLTDNMVFSGAQKKGMPTQSTSITLYLLLRLVDLIKENSSPYDHLFSLSSDDFFQLKQHWSKKEREWHREKRLTFLGNRLTWGLALTGSNLLSCGPQIHADAFPVEEFHHALRLNQVTEQQHFILLPGSHAEMGFYKKTQSELLIKGATVDIIDIQPNMNTVNHIFYTLQYLYEMSWRLAVDFIEQGGQRVIYQENA